MSNIAEAGCPISTRELEGAIQHTHRLNEIADEVMGRLVDMRNRLLGSANQVESNSTAKAEVRPVHSECHDLRERLDTLDARLKRITGVVSELEQV